MNLLKNVFIFSLGLGLGALALAATQKRSLLTPQKNQDEPEKDLVDCSSEDSFPASDPPAWSTPSDLH
jgi:hypothetical protein